MLPWNVNARNVLYILLYSPHTFILIIQFYVILPPFPFQKPDVRNWFNSHINYASVFVTRCLYDLIISAYEVCPKRQWTRLSNVLDKHFNLKAYVVHKVQHQLILADVG